MRKLVTVRKVSDVQPIDGADRIELAMVDGWNVVVKKGDFKPGDKAIYFEIDSHLPVRPEFEFLRKSSYKEMDGHGPGFRLRTIRLRGQVSQGLLMPIDTFPELTTLDLHAGDDLTSELDVVKYEPPVHVCLGGKIKGYFPSFVRKTDEERIQNLSDWFEKYRGMKFELSEKLDGTSMTVYFNKGNFGVCSRNMDLQEDTDNALWRITREQGVIDVLEAYHGKYDKNLAIQGEVVGEGIQKNRLKLKGNTFYVFNIFDIDEYRYLTPMERCLVLSSMKELTGKSFNHVPILAGDMKIFERCSTMGAMLEFVKGASVFGEDNEIQREGIVFKSCERVNGDIVSFKAINNDYLLKHGE